MTKVRIGLIDPSVKNILFKYLDNMVAISAPDRRKMASKMYQNLAWWLASGLIIPEIRMAQDGDEIIIEYKHEMLGQTIESVLDQVEQMIKLKNLTSRKYRVSELKKYISERFTIMEEKR